MLDLLHTFHSWAKSLLIPVFYGSLDWNFSR